MYSACLEGTIVYHCAPTLVGLKAASLLSLSASAYPALPALVGAYDRLLSPSGLRLEILCRCDRRFLVLVYRPAALERHLAARAARALLHAAGYAPEGSLAAWLDHLRGRLGGGDGFPHEIGLFLGYPPEDVHGFLADPGDHCRLCGYWKVYHNVDETRARFAQFDRCRAALLSRLEAGFTLSQLFGACRAPAA